MLTELRAFNTNIEYEMDLNKVTNSIDHITSGEPNSYSHSKEIANILWTAQFITMFTSARHRSLSLSQVNPIHIFQSTSKIQF
jgi:hypothetical protein